MGKTGYIVAMKISAIRGVKDILPDEIVRVQQLEDTARRLFERFGYSEIRIPIFEVTELFTRGIGTTTDIVEKEMYTFEDRDGKKLTLRPEGTASVVRAYIEHQMYLQKPVTKLYYLGPMFRHERPQAGRFRQFYQIGIEALGTSSAAMDVEILAVLIWLLQEADVTGIQLELNSLGDSVCRPQYRKALKSFLKDNLHKLCEECQKRYETNPLRILDCKNESCRAVTAAAPSPLDHLCQDCLAHFEQVKSGLDQLKIPFVINQRLVRGLDYYNRTAFEVTTGRLGAQNSIAGGGRYDGLTEELGGPPTPGIGFAMGVERIASLMKPVEPPKPDFFFALLGEEALKQMLPVIMQLRREGLRIEIDYGGGNLKKQMGLSDKLGARYTLILGENELKSGKAILRNMTTKEQQELVLSTLSQTLKSLVKP
ncbi:MAG TPA: histidine--tRNA ligase [Nitrospiria bacterium]|nr:histidine--tRNA ligase [Nitrospiria bacterium]